MIVIRLRPFVLAALALALTGAGLVIGGDLTRFYLLAHIGIMVSTAGIALSAIAWIDSRLASVESAFIIGAKLGEDDVRQIRSL